jgi:hypothetical protein
MQLGQRHGQGSGRRRREVTGAAYNALTKQLRRVAGSSMREAWQGPALSTDDGMNIGTDRVDLSALKDAEQAFLDAAKSHVAALTTPLWRRALNKLRRLTDRGAGAGAGESTGEPAPPAD